MFGLLYALESVAPLLLMCDRRDLGTAIGERPFTLSRLDVAEGSSADSESTSPLVGALHATPHLGAIDEFTPTRLEDSFSFNPKEFFEPNLYLFDAYPGGIGFSEPLFRTHPLLMQKTRELISACPCDNGCPSCVGPANDLAPRAKEAALPILERLCA